MEATVAICKCNTCKKLYGIRFEKRFDGWHYTWAFPINEKTAIHEGYSKTKVSGTLICDANYPGCPHCSNKGFFVCSSCGKITCWDGKGSKATCAWCGNSGELTNEIGSIDVTDNI